MLPSVSLTKNKGRVFIIPALGYLARSSPLLLRVQDSSFAEPDELVDRLLSSRLAKPRVRFVQERRTRATNVQCIRAVFRRRHSSAGLIYFDENEPRVPVFFYPSLYPLVIDAFFAQCENLAGFIHLDMHINAGGFNETGRCYSGLHQKRTITSQ